MSRRERPPTVEIPRTEPRRAAMKPFAPLAMAALSLAFVPGGCDGKRDSRGAGDSRTATKEAVSSSKLDFPSSFPRRFTDVTGGSGLASFVHETGGFGEKWLPETLGAGASFLDANGDGHVDIFFVNGSLEWPESESARSEGAGAGESEGEGNGKGKGEEAGDGTDRGSSGGEEPLRSARHESAKARDKRPTCALFLGRGDGTFADASTSWHADVSLQGMGAAVADHDGDGDPDVYITAVGENVLLENQGDHFIDATARAGLAGRHWRDREGRDHVEWSTAATWADFDGDGDLDLLVTGYVEWAPRFEIFTTLDGTHKAFTTPDRYRGLPPRLYENRGDGTYTDVTKSAGLADLRGKSLGIALWDFGDDGWIDAVVANDTRPNFLLLNRGDLHFEDVALERGIAYDQNGRALAGMGIDIADLTGNRHAWIAIGNFAQEPLSLWREVEGDGFAGEAERAGLAQGTRPHLAFGVLWRDLDLDGLLDLAVVNGHIEPDIARFHAGESHAQPSLIFQGIGASRFRDASAESGAALATPRIARGLAAADVDGDGDLDLLLTTNGGPPTLLRNDLAPGTKPHHFLRVRLRGRSPNTDAIGAKVVLETAGRTDRRLVRRGSSYLSDSETTLTFGLGVATTIDRLTVTWPRGRTEVLPVGAIDREIVIAETAGSE